MREADAALHGKDLKRQSEIERIEVSTPDHSIVDDGSFGFGFALPHASSDLQLLVGLFGEVDPNSLTKTQVATFEASTTLRALHNASCGGDRRRFDEKKGLLLKLIASLERPARNGRELPRGVRASSIALGRTATGEPTDIELSDVPGRFRDKGRPSKPAERADIERAVVSSYDKVRAAVAGVLKPGGARSSRLRTIRVRLGGRYSKAAIELARENRPITPSTVTYRMLAIELEERTGGKRLSDAALRKLRYEHDPVTKPRPSGPGARIWREK